MSLAADWLSWGLAALGGGLTSSGNLPVPVDAHEKAQRRALAKQQEYGQGWLTGLIGGLRTKSGERVSSDNSVSVAAVYACTRVLSEDIAKLDVGLFRRTPDGGQIRILNHPVARVLRNPSDWINRYKFKQILQTTAVLYGNGFAVIQRDANGRPEELLPVTQVPTPQVVENELIWHITLGREWDAAQFEGVTAGTVHDRDMLRIPGWGTDTLLGLGIPNVAREPIGTLMATEEHAAKFFANGTTFGGVLGHPNRLDDTARSNLRHSMEQVHRGVSNSFRLLLLEEGLSFTPVGIDSEKAQLTESRRFGVEEVARAFRMPPNKIMDYSRATFNNIEEINIGYADDTLMPWVENWEASMDQKLLTQRERDLGMFIQFDLESLKRANLASRTQAARDLVQSGIITINESRQRLGANPVEGGDIFLRPVNMVAVPEGETGEAQMPAAEPGGSEEPEPAEPEDGDGE